ncbi:MAG TPA: hypothetical protein VIL48_16175 [Acidimicrobiales bacterium]
MRFSDRFKQAAEAARTALQSPDVALLGEASAIRGRQILADDPRDVDVARRVRELGAPDPYSLITHDEVVALTGIPVGGPTLTWADDDIGVRFDAEDGRGQVWSFGVHAGHAVEPGAPFDPVSWYEWMVALLDRATPVPGLGDAAVYQSGLLYVRGEGRAFYVLVEAPERSPSEQWAAAIARRVLERFASGEAR